MEVYHKDTFSELVCFWFILSIYSILRLCPLLLLVTALSGRQSLSYIHHFLQSLAILDLLPFKLMPSAPNWIKHPFICVLHAGLVHPQAHWHCSLVHHCRGSWRGEKKMKKSADECADVRVEMEFLLVWVVAAGLPSRGEAAPSILVLLLARVLWVTAPKHGLMMARVEGSELKPRSRYQAQ